MHNKLNDAQHNKLNGVQHNKLELDTVWLTQVQLAELFQRERTVVTKHIINVFKEGELEEKSNVHFLQIQINR